MYSLYEKGAVESRYIYKYNIVYLLFKTGSWPGQGILGEPAK